MESNLVSMSCFIEITNDLSELTHYDDIKKIFDLSNSILKNGVDHSNEEKNLEVTFNDVKIELTSEKSNRALSVEVVEFFDYVTKQKRLAFINSPNKELKQFGLKFENKNTTHIAGYTVTLKDENDKLYLEKELFFNEDKLLETLIKENDNKNVIFMKYQGKIYLFKLELIKAFLKKLKDNDKEKFQTLLNIGCISYWDNNLSISYGKKHDVCKLEISDCSLAATFYNIWRCQFVSFARIVCQKQIFYERF